MGEINLRINAELAERLERLSARSGASPEAVAISAILDRVEEMEDAPTVRRRMEELEDGAVAAIPHDELIRRLGLED